MPGPVIEVERGRPVTIDWVNRLPTSHRLAIDHSLCGGGRRAYARRGDTAEWKTTHGSADGKRFMDPITEDPIQGSTEIWEFVNTTLDAHPIHLHAVRFQLLERRSFSRSLSQPSEIAFSQKPLPLSAEEVGWKDTILCPPGQVTRIITPFTADAGRYVWHCHMLEHEDNEMMRPYQIRPQ